MIGLVGCLARLVGLTALEHTAQRWWAANHLAREQRRVAELELACTSHPLDQALLAVAHAHLADVERRAT